MTTYFYGSALSGEFWRNRNYEPLTIDQATGTVNWDAQGKDELRAYLLPANFVDSQSIPITTLSVTLTIINAANSCRGELVIPDFGATIPTLTFAGTSEGLFNPAENSILSFRLIDNIFYWESDKDARAYSLADTSLVVFEVDPVNGVDAENSPLKQSIPYTIGLIKKFCPFSRIQPAQNASWSGDRFFAVEIRLHPGIYNSSNFLQYFVDYGIKIIGLGVSPSDVEIFGNNATSCFVINGCSDIEISNLRLNSNRPGINMINCGRVIARNLEFFSRNLNPTNFFNMDQYCTLHLLETMKIASVKANRFLNAGGKCSVTGSPIIFGSGSPIEFTGSLILAEKDSDVYLGGLTFEANTTATGVARIVNDKSIVQLPENLPNLTY